MVGFGNPKGVATCVAPVARLAPLISGLRTRAPVTRAALAHVNVKPHARERTKALEEVVHRRYARDLELWGAARHGGALCW